mmetsp:Transcript_26322/g.39872  ORF Transcript_26322/g.39872 Transcript_26322/m.39872 type:complete len:103 (-) Transcript_26322:311-619(-)
MFESGATAVSPAPKTIGIKQMRAFIDVFSLGSNTNPSNHVETGSAALTVMTEFTCIKRKLALSVTKPIQNIQLKTIVPVKAFFEGQTFGLPTPSNSKIEIPI